MNRRCVLFLLAAAMSSSARAQSPMVSMYVKADAERPMIEISNMHAIPIEAFLITVDISGRGGRLTRIYYDTHVYYKHDLPIPGGTSKPLPLPHRVGGSPPLTTLQAVVFSDGTTVGDPVWVNELLDRRRIISDRLQEVITLLQQASEENLAKEETLTRLNQARQTRKQAIAGATPEEQVLHDLIFYDAVTNLDPKTEVEGKPVEFSARLRVVQRAFTMWLADVQAARPSGATIAGKN